MASETFQLYLLLTAKDLTSGTLSKVEARLHAIDKEAKAAAQSAGAGVGGIGKHSTAAAAGVAALNAEHKAAAKEVAIVGNVATESGQKSSTAARNSAAAELSLEEQRRAAASLQRQRSAALIREQRTQERASQRLAAEEQRAAAKAKQAFGDISSLREAVKKDLITGAAGVGTLYLMAKGLKVAGDFEQSVTDLKVAITEVGRDGAVNLAKLNDQMARFEALGMRLGNTLPGSTQDFMQMFAVLKQGGMQTENILGGAGQAVANLAVATHQDPSALAKDYAQFGEMFQLKTQKEWEKSADIFARVYRATGVDSSEMVQGLKFAQVRAGANIGLHGLEGAESLGRILGTLRTFGLEGGFGGRELSRFLMQTASFEKNAAKLKKKEGIDLKKMGINLQFFDKGKFMGFDNIFKQLEKLRVLTDQQRIKVGEKVFTAEGTAIATAFMTAGEEGWKKINDRVDAVLPLEQQILAVTDTWNAKLENVKGTLSNLTASAFTPMLDKVKPLADTTNQWAGSLQEVAKAHPGAAATIADFVGLAGIALTLAGGLKAATTAWALYSLAAKYARLEMAGVAGEAGRVERTVGRLAGMKTLRLTVQFIVAGYAIEQILKWKAEYDEQQKNLAEKTAGVGASYDEAMRSGQLYKPSGKGDRGRYERLALQSLDALKMGQGLEMDLEPDRAGLFTHFWTAQRPYASRWGTQLNDNFTRPFNPDIFAGVLRHSEVSKPLQDPNVLARFLSQARINMQLSPEGFELFKQGVEKAMAGVTTPQGTPVYTEALKILDQEMGELGDQAKQAGTNLQAVSQWFGPTNQLPGAFQRAGDAATRFSLRLGGLDFPRAQVGLPQFNVSPTPAVTPTFKFGKTSLVSQADGRDVHHHHGDRTVHLHVHGVQDPGAIADMVAHHLEIASERA
jgi:hypothetical protein